MFSHFVECSRVPENRLTVVIDDLRHQQDLGTVVNLKIGDRDY